MLARKRRPSSPTPPRFVLSPPIVPAFPCRHFLRVLGALGAALLAACGGHTEDDPALLGDCLDSTCEGGGDAGGASVDGGSTTTLVPSAGIHEVTGALGGGACPATATVNVSGATFTPDVSLCCTSGFELNDATDGSTYTLASLDPEGAAATTLAVDLATYEEPDRVALRATVSGQAIALFDSCELQTGPVSDPTGGKVRPPDSMVRSFAVQVPAGTTALTFDFAGVKSPMYLRTVGLCSFDVDKAPAYRWSAVDLDADGGSCTDGESIR